MKLSIITTIYQAEKDLPRLLDSMMEQKSGELEFYLIDNGCTDRSHEICEQYVAKDSRFKLVTLPENIGYIRARNYGLEHVEADYIGFCDSDDFLEPGGYDTAIDIICRNRVDLFIGSWNTISGDKVNINRPPFKSGLYESDDISQILPQFFGFLPKRPMLRAFVWKQIYNLQLIRKHNLLFELHYVPCEDIIFNAEYIKICKSIAVDSVVLYNYVVNSDSITYKTMREFSFSESYNRIIAISKRLDPIMNSSLCSTANANQSIQTFITSTHNLVRSKQDINEAYSLIDKTVDNNTIRKFCEQCNGLDIKSNFISFLIKHRQYKIILSIYRLFNILIDR